MGSAMIRLIAGERHDPTTFSRQGLELSIGKSVPGGDSGVPESPAAVLVWLDWCLFLLGGYACASARVAARSGLGGLPAFLPSSVRRAPALSWVWALLIEGGWLVGGLGAPRRATGGS